jgi:betaine-homocysteine S-methyltransferase
MFDEQVGWAAEAGVDYVIAETISWTEEALIALDVIRGFGLPAVVTLAIHRDGTLRDGLTPPEACKRLNDAGADVVGLNCIRGPWTMLPLLRAIREEVGGYVAGLPVPYRTTDAEPTFQSLTDSGPHAELLPEHRPFPTALDSFACNRYEIAQFARQAYALGVTYLGVCCGAGPHHIRALAEALGRTPPANRYSADMSRHAFLGTDERIPEEYRQYAREL